MKNIKESITDFTHIITWGGSDISVRAEYKGDKASMASEYGDDSDRYNLIEVKYGDDTGTFEVWGKDEYFSDKELKNFEEDVFVGFKSIFNMASFYVITRGYEDFCEEVMIDPMSVTSGVLYARAYGYVEKLKKIGFSEQDISEIGNKVYEVGSLEEFQDKYEDEEPIMEESNMVKSFDKIYQECKL